MRHEKEKVSQKNKTKLKKIFWCFVFSSSSNKIKYDKDKRKKILCVPEVLPVSHRGWSTERDHRLQVGGMQQVPRITDMIGLYFFINK